MKFIKFLIAIALAIVFVPSAAFSQDFKSNMYLSDVTFTNLPPNFSQKSYRNFLSKEVSEIIRTSKSVILDSATTKYLDPKGIRTARELLLGKANLPIFLTGNGLRSNSLKELLEIKTKTNKELMFCEAKT